MTIYHDLFVEGVFTSHSGRTLPFKVDVDALSDASIECIAKHMARRHDFSHVHGIPRGGIRLANALLRYQAPSSLYALVVDDVYTSGQSMERARVILSNAGYPWDKILGMTIWAWDVPPRWIRTMNQLWAPIPSEL